jgi:hypothetical protein
MPDWIKRVGWIVVGSYIVGAVVTELWMRFRDLPPISPSSVISLDSAVFGGICIACGFFSSLAALVLVERSPVREAKTFFEHLRRRSNRPVEENTTGGVVFRVLFNLFIWVMPALAGSMLAARLFAGNARDFTPIWRGLFLSYLGLWLFAWLATRPHLSSEPDLMTPKQAHIFGWEPGSYLFAYVFVGLGLLYGIWMWQYTSQGLGGGSPFRAVLTLEDSTAAMFANGRPVSGTPLHVVLQRGDYLVVRPISQDSSGIETIVLRRSDISAMTVR